MGYRGFFLLIVMIASCALVSSARAAEIVKDDGEMPLPKPEAVETIDPLQGVKDDLAVCSQQEKRALRLQCYDDLSVQMGAMLAENHENERKLLGDFGFWDVSIRETETGDHIIYLKLDAKEEIKTRLGYKKRPTLVLRCQDKATDVYVDWKSQLGSGSAKNLYINYKFDGLPLQGEEWQYSLDFYSVFSPHPVEFVKILKEKAVLGVELTPVAEASQTAAFELEGIKNALGVLVKECYN